MLILVNVLFSLVIVLGVASVALSLWLMFTRSGKEYWDTHRPDAKRRPPGQP